MFEDKFLCGAVYGFLAAGIIGWILGHIREERGRFGQQNRPLNTFPDAIQGSLTPRKIVWSGFGALFNCVFWVLFLLVMLYLIGRLGYYLVTSH